nr:PREDICTED: interleukin-18-like isoform X2 [Lepisosteus oculatus]
MSCFPVTGEKIKFALCNDQGVFFEGEDNGAMESDSFMSSNKADYCFIRNSKHMFLVVTSECLHFEKRTTKQWKSDDMRFLLKVFNNTEDHRDAAVALELHGEGRTRALYCKEESTVAYKETALADTIPGDSHESIFYLRRIQDNTFTLESSKYKGSYLFCYQDGPCYKLILKKMTDEVDEGQHVTIESCSDEDP